MALTGLKGHIIVTKVISLFAMAAIKKEEINEGRFGFSRQREKERNIE